MPEADRRTAPRRLCHIDDVPDRGARGFDLEGLGQDSVFAVRRGAVVHLWRDRCPHAGTPMAWRKDAYLNAAGDRIVCAAHGAQFEVDTGLCVLGPCLGERLQALPVIVDAAGDLVLSEL
jgi:nitrite reductase/ring-hydroxylating ferredoxin subunit